MLSVVILSPISNSEMKQFGMAVLRGFSNSNPNSKIRGFSNRKFVLENTHLALEKDLTTFPPLILTPPPHEGTSPIGIVGVPKVRTRTLESSGTAPNA